MAGSDIANKPPFGDIVKCLVFEVSYIKTSEFFWLEAYRGQKCTAYYSSKFKISMPNFEIENGEKEKKNY